MDALQTQCEDANNYPRNIPLFGHSRCIIELKYRQLVDQEPRLFCKDEKAKLDFLEFSSEGKGQQ